MNSSKFKWGIGVGVILVALLIFSQLKFGGSLVYFYTPQEVWSKTSELAGQNIRVGGLVKSGSVLWDAAQQNLTFVATDNQGTQLIVHYHGIKPDLFRENQGVIVEGVINPAGNAFLANKLMVKHSEQYRSSDHQGKNIDKELIEKSLIKD